MTKTNFMIFYPRQNEISVTVPLVMEYYNQASRGNSLELSLISTFLGNVILVFVSQKISKTVGIIAKSCYYLSSKSLLTLYSSPVYPYVSYCNVAWSSTYCSNLGWIYLLQKLIVRLISRAHYVIYQT